MKSRPDSGTTPDEKMEAFNGYLGEVLKCSKAQVDRALAYERKMKEGKPKSGPKPSSSAHASRKKD